jgi:DNA mismatch repair ATPase MutS
MVRAAATAQHLFLLDELFRGTNTVERIAAGVAVMEVLVAGSNMAIVATHDSEVVRLVSDTYDAWHFAESVTANGFAFDFVLRHGPAVKRNAISLLRAIGAPESITDRATEICSILEEAPIPVPIPVASEI